MEKSKMRTKRIASALAAGALALGASAAFATPASADEIDDLFSPVDQFLAMDDEALGDAIADGVSNGLAAVGNAVGSVAQGAADTVNRLGDPNNTEIEDAGKSFDDAVNDEISKLPDDQAKLAAGLVEEAARAAAAPLDSVNDAVNQPGGLLGQRDDKPAPGLDAQQPNQDAGVQKPADDAGAAPSSNAAEQKPAGDSNKVSTGSDANKSAGTAGQTSGNSDVQANAQQGEAVAAADQPEIKPVAEVQAKSGKSDVAKAADGDGKLAYTGVSVLVPAAVVGLALAGAGAVMVTRRRRTAKSEA